MGLMKRILCLIICAVFALTAFGCAKEKTENETPKETEAETVLLSYDGKGEYTGFENIPAEYTAEQAIEDGCLVIDITSGENSETKVSGSEVWHNFMTKAKNGEEITMRVAYFIDGKASFEDLYFTDNRYLVFVRNDNGIYKKSDFTMIRLLEKSDGTDAFYVLTDSEKLTYEEAYPFLTDTDAESDINFDFLPFTFYVVG